MLIVRPIEERDLAALYELAKITGVGFTSLPANEAILAEKIARSNASFASQVDTPGDQCYLMVAEDSDSGTVVGTCAIEAAVGTNDAFYHYNLGKVVHSSRELNIHKSIQTLTLCNDYTGATELCTLFLHPDYRHSSNGQLLSRSRFLLMAAHQHRFADTVIAEMRGVSDEQGRSPFWGWLEEHFFDLDFPTADYLTGMGNKVFIAELMPKYPIYVSLLSAEAQAVIGQVHEKTRPALHLLEKEGLRNKGYVDIFDAGPTVECDLQQIKTVKHSREGIVTLAEIDDTPAEHLIANPAIEQFRATLGCVLEKGEGEVIISPATAQALQLEAGDNLRYCRLKPTDNSNGNGAS